MAEKLYEVASEYYNLKSRRLPLSIHYPKEKTERSKICVLQVHTGIYALDFEPCTRLAERGFTTAGLPLLVKQKTVKQRMEDVKAAVEYLRSRPGIEKIVLFGHSQGGCILSGYQYIAENGTDRFMNQDRFLPFPEIEKLPPADGLILVDANYGFMDVLACDPAVDRNNGYKRNPELDLMNPENGYVPGKSRYTEEFKRKFQQAQVKAYMDLTDECKMRYEDMKRGRGKFADDDLILLPGWANGSTNNKMFMQDNSLLSRSRGVYPVVYNGGIVKNELAHACRPAMDTIPSYLYKGGCEAVTVLYVLQNEYRFTGEFGYNEDSMWGVDWDFNPLHSQGNVKGITVPLLCHGNLGSHEFINVEYSYEKAASKDKSIFFLAGATHELEPVKSAESFPGEFGNPAITFADYVANWLSVPGRF